MNPSDEMSPKFAGNQARVAGRIMKRVRRNVSGCTTNPSDEMPPKLAGNQASVNGRIMKRVWITKRVRRRKEKPSPPLPPWSELPREITANILHRLGAVTILETAQRVCSSWLSVSKDPSMWRVIDMGYDGDMPYDIDDKCRKAVDRSQGQLVDINLRSFPTDETLDYIAKSAGNLRKLRLVCCYRLSGKGLIEAVKRFPNLEELHIILSLFSDETIEMVGRSCPLLRSFTFNGKATRSTGYDYDNEIFVVERTMPKLRNEDAFAIARSMPGLRRLELLVNGLTNEGLEAILDGCPHLESLDIRRCFHVRLMEDLEKRMSAQIKCLRWPNDSISDYGFEVNDNDTSDWSPDCGPTWSDYEDWQ